MNLPLRHRLLAAAAFATALGTGFVANLDERDGAPAGEAGALLPPPRAAAGGRETLASGRGASLARGDWTTPTAEALRAWGQEQPGPTRMAPPAARVVATARSGPAVAAAPAAGVASAAVASAPPAPAWRLIGRVDDAGRAQALLATPQQLRVVAGGDRLDDHWRVERIDADAVELRALADGQMLRLAWEAR